LIACPTLPIKPNNWGQIIGVKIIGVRVKLNVSAIQQTAKRSEKIKQALDERKKPLSESTKEQPSAMTNDTNASQIPQDQAECQQLASQVSNQTPTQSPTGAIVGAFSGTASDSGTLKQAPTEESYKKAFINCMRNRGHDALN